MNDTAEQPPPDATKPPASTDLELKITAAEAGVRAARTRLNVSRYVSVAAAVLVFVVVHNLASRIGVYESGLLPLALGFAGLVIALTEALQRAAFAKREGDLDLLEARKRLLAQLPSPTAEGDKKDYFDALVSINVDNLASYYSLVKTQTDKSFMVSLSMGVAGFILLIAGLALGFSNSQRAAVITYISTGAGVLTEFIASVFFYLYNRTIRQMKGYHDSLLDVQNVLLAFKLVGDTKVDAHRNEMMGKMLEFLMQKRTASQSDGAEPEGKKASAASA
jgi:hypothetical protein